MHGPVIVSRWIECARHPRAYPSDAVRHLTDAEPDAVSAESEPPQSQYWEAAARTKREQEVKGQLSMDSLLQLRQQLREEWESTPAGQAKMEAARRATAELAAMTPAERARKLRAEAQEIWRKAQDVRVSPATPPLQRGCRVPPSEDTDDDARYDVPSEVDAEENEMPGAEEEPERSDEDSDGPSDWKMCPRCNWPVRVPNGDPSNDVRCTSRAGFCGVQAFHTNAGRWALRLSVPAERVAEWGAARQKGRGRQAPDFLLGDGATCEQSRMRWHPRRHGPVDWRRWARTEAIPRSAGDEAFKEALKAARC